MSLLLDSHTLLWWIVDPDRVGPMAQSAITDEAVHVSAVTVWELGIKVAQGKLEMPEPPSVAVEANEFHPLPITFAHAIEAAALPTHHRDPFDRMLVAQARIEGLTLVTADQGLRDYDVALMDARR